MRSLELLRRQSRVSFFLCLWIVSVAGGLLAVAAYSNSPTPASGQPSSWPENPAIRRESGRPTLLMLLHPKCSCSHATISELSRLLAQSKVPLRVKILLYEPGGAPTSWQQSDLANEARSIPGAAVIVDRGGVTASHFGMSVSGQTALYAAGGQLLFSGGITAARGHAGDNAGHSAIRDILFGIRPATRHTPVFGCSIRNAS